MLNLTYQNISKMQLADRITTNPGIFNGKPIIRGIRLGVADVLGYLAAGMTFDQILADFLTWKERILLRLLSMRKIK